MTVVFLFSTMIVLHNNNNTRNKDTWSATNSHRPGTSFDITGTCKPKITQTKAAI